MKVKWKKIKKKDRKKLKAAILKLQGSWADRDDIDAEEIRIRWCNAFGERIDDPGELH